MQVIEENRDEINALFNKLSVEPVEKDYYDIIRSYVDAAKKDGGTGYTYGDFSVGKNDFFFEVKRWLTEADSTSMLHLTHVRGPQHGDGNLCWTIEGMV